MKVVANEWSWSGMDLSGNFTAVERFIEMVDFLSKFEPLAILVPENYADLKLCDYPIRNVYYTEKTYQPLSEDRRKRLLQLVKKFVKTAVDNNEDSVLLHLTEDSLKSRLLYFGWKENLEAISFLFDQIYDNDTLICRKPLNEKGLAKLVNLHSVDKIKERYDLFIDKAFLKDTNLGDTPFPNSVATRKYIGSITEEEKSSVKQDQSVKMAYLQRHAEKIALLNGWTMDERVTKNNSNSGAHRLIFNSSRFSGQPTHYLSVDFEKIDFFFELHDKRGRHLGEFKWDNKKSDAPDSSGKHDITV